MKKGHVGIIVLNYNGWYDTIECLESLYKQSYITFQVIVVDNSESNTSIEKIKSWASGEIKEVDTSFPTLVYPLSSKPLDVFFLTEDELHQTNSTDLNDNLSPLVLLKANQNKGFAAGNNVGVDFCLKKGGFDHLWFLNNDTVADKYALEKLVDYIRYNNEIGIVGSKLLYYNEPNKIQALGGKLNPLFLTTTHLGEGEKPTYSLVEDIDYPVGASMFLSMEYLQKVGKMYEKYFLYFEEIDWVIRGRKYGWKPSVCQESIVYHKEGASIGSGNGTTKSEFSDLISLNSRLLFAKRHFKWRLPFVYLGYIIVLFNRIYRRQYKRAFKILKILVRNEFKR